MTETVPMCHLCHAPLAKKTITTGNASGLALGFICLGAGICLCVTGVGIIIGVPLIICALFMGGKRQKFLCCPNCGAKTPAV